MKIEQKEKRTHGTAFFPFHVYTHYALNQYFVFYHWHEEVELIYVEQGCMELILNGTSYLLQEDEYMFIHPGSLHQLQAKETSLHHAIVFHPKLLNFQDYDVVQNAILTPLQEGEYRYPVQIQNRYIYDQIANLCKEIIHTSLQNTAGNFKVKIHLLTIIQILYEQHLLEQHLISHHETLTLENIKYGISYMEEHLADKIMLDEIAQLLHMNPNYFCRYFKKQTGLSPMAYLLQMRIEQSVKLLSTTEAKVLDIALSCGFDNFSYFIRKFKFYKGMTPMQYRNSLHAYNS